MSSQSIAILLLLDSPQFLTIMNTAVMSNFICAFFDVSLYDFSNNVILSGIPLS